MNIINHKFIFLSALCVAGAAWNSVSAQNLSEEVVIDREITPTVRDIPRPSWVTPSILNPRFDTKRLSFSEYVGTAEINRGFTPLEPTAWADSVMRSSYRGYASIGYFPTFNLGAAAGYRFIKNKNIDLGAKLSYEGGNWKNGAGSTGKNSQNKAAVGIDGTFLSKYGKLTANLGYSWHQTGMAQYDGLFNRGSQSLNNFDLNAKWTAKTIKSFGWNLGLNFDYGSFANDKQSLIDKFIFVPIDTKLKPASDINFGLSSDISWSFVEKMAVALDIDFRFRHTSDFAHLQANAEILELDQIIKRPFASIENYGAQSMGVISLTPMLKFGFDDFKGHLGIQADFKTGGFNHGFNIAPDIDIRWSPSTIFGAYIKATGGEFMNSNSDLWERCPWMTGMMTYERSRVNADVEIGLTYGSFQGFWAGVYGGWSHVSNWLAPVNINGINTWSTLDSFSGFNFGVEAGYAYDKYFTLKGSIEGASHRKYYKWQDNAKWVAKIETKITPIEKLDINIGYEVRTHRSGYTMTPTLNEFDNQPVFTFNNYSLGLMSNLFAGAKYDIIDAFSAFVRAENLINHKHIIVGDVQSRGITGLIGLQYKF